MLKRYHTADVPASSTVHTCHRVAALIVTDTPYEDDIRVPPLMAARLPNSAALDNLSTQLRHLTAAQQEDMESLVSRYQCLFSDVPSCTTVLKHDIDVRDARPIKQHAYRVNPFKRELMKQEVEYLLNNGLATVSASSWSSPCMVEAKPDGSPRFITDSVK